MKKILVLLATFLLTACSAQTNIEDEIEDQQVTNETTTKIVVIDREKDLSTTTTFSHVEQYPTFNDMLASETGTFHYLTFVNVSDFSEYANEFTFVEYNTTEEVKIILYKDTYNFRVGMNYVVHIFTDAETGLNFISDNADGIFFLDSDNNLICSDKFDSINDQHFDSVEDFLNMFNLD